MKNDWQTEEEQENSQIKISFTTNKAKEVSWLDIVFQQMKKISFKYREQLKAQSDELIAQELAQQEKIKQAQREKDAKEFQLKHDQTIKASQFLQSELYDYYFAMVKNGYEPNTNQGNQIYEKMNAIVEENTMEKSIQILEKFIESGYSLQPGILVKMLTLKLDKGLINQETLLNNQGFKDTPYFSREFNRLLSDPHVANILFQDFYEKHITLPNMSFNSSSVYLDKKGNSHPVSSYLNRTLEKMLSVINYAYLCQEAPDLFLKNVKFDFYLEAYNDLIEDKKTVEKMTANQSLGIVTLPESFFLEKKFGKLINFFDGFNTDLNTELSMEMMIEWQDALKIFKENILDNYYKNQIEHHLQTTKMIYAKDYVEHIQAKKLTNQINSYDIHDLPLAARDVLNQISVMSLKLQSYYDKQDTQTQFEVDNLLNKRVPEAIVKYMSIDIDYRQSLKNHSGKSAEDLMLETLKNYQEKLENIYVQCNENQLSDLSAINRYSHKIK
jgi:hypothetical protein